MAKARYTDLGCGAPLVKIDNILPYLLDMQKVSLHLSQIIHSITIIMNKGKVKFFNETKGFGFIVDSESSKEYFVHVTGLVDEIRENDEVTFDLKEGRKGLNAVNVKVV
jgi:CspA family cold shock protein